MTFSYRGSDFASIATILFPLYLLCTNDHTGCGLNLYHFLAPDAYSQLLEFVPLIDRTAVSSVYDVSTLAPHSTLPLNQACSHGLHCFGYASLFTSTPLQVMPKFSWSDGSCKYLYVNVHRLEQYLVCKINARTISGSGS